MKFKYYLFLAYKSLFYKKVTFLNICILVLSMVMLVCTSSFSSSFNNMINNQINGNIKHHILVTHEIEDFSLLNNIDNILYVSDYTSFGHYVETVDNEQIYLIGVPDDAIEVINGKKLSANANKHTMICPSKFYLGEEPEVYDSDFLKKIINGREILNQFVKISSLNYEEDYEVIGIYDVNKYSYGEYNICFTSQSNINNIFDKETEYLVNQCDPEKFDCSSIGEYSGTIIVVDDVKIINNTLKDLETKGLNAHQLININTSGINFITGILVTITFIITIINFVLQFISNNKFIHYNKKNNLIYKSLGYSNKMLIKLNYLESLLISVISFFISLIFIFAIYVICNIIFIVDIKTGFSICVPLQTIIFGFIVNFLVTILAVFFSLKNNNNSIIEEFSDEEI